MAREVWETFVARGLLTSDQLARARAAQRELGGSLVTNIVELGFAEDERLAKILAQTLHVPFLRDDALEWISAEVISYVPREVAETHRIVPLRLDGRELHVCLADPSKLDEIEEIARTLGRVLVPAMVTEAAITEALDRHYGVRTELRFSPEATAAPPAQVVRTVTAQIERTGLFKVPAPLLAQASAPEPEARRDPVELLAEVRSGDDIVRAAFTFATDLFDEVAVLGVHKGRALVLYAGNRAGPRSIAPTDLPLAQGSVLWAVLARPQVAHRARIEEQSFLGLCRAVKMPPADVSIIPVFENGRPVFIIVGSGRNDQEVKQRFHEIKTFLVKVSLSLRIVALRNDIRGEPRDAARGPGPAPGR